MKNLSWLFVFALFAQDAMCESLLKATKFPKVFEDLSFIARMELKKDSYAPFEMEYDENGVCVSGCVYNGITIKEDMDAVDEATYKMSELVRQYKYKKPNFPKISGGGYNGNNESWCKNGLTTELPLRFPVDMSNFKYKISSDFGFRNIELGSKFHPALDIGVPVGTPVYATADGVVDKVWFDNNGGGNVIDIKHDNDLITQYLHLSKQLVRVGDRVYACQKIAESGDTGVSSGPHLDYRIRFKSDRNMFVDILCPEKSSNRNTQRSSDINIINDGDKHSLFFAKYKFKNQSAKNSQWRVNHGHCMFNINDLLPDEVAP